MDDFVSYSPLDRRAKLTLPAGKRVAINVVMNIEHYEYLPPVNPHRDYFYRVAAKPDIVGYSFRDFGNRVGFWRMLPVLDDSPVKVTCSLNCEVLRLYPDIAEAMVERRWSFMSHGTYNTRLLFGATESQEREFYDYTVATVQELTGYRMRGMLGPSFSATPNTYRLMAEAGMTYTTDWFIDDQPFRLDGPQGGDLIGVPYSREVNDALIFPGSPMFGLDSDYFAQIVRSQYEVLSAEAQARDTAYVMTVALHPLYMGIPHRIGHLAEMFEHLASQDDIWWTTPEEIAAHVDQIGWC